MVAWRRKADAVVAGSLLSLLFTSGTKAGADALRLCDFAISAVNGGDGVEPSSGVDIMSGLVEWLGAPAHVVTEIGVMRNEDKDPDAAVDERGSRPCISAIASSKRISKQSDFLVVWKHSSVHSITSTEKYGSMQVDSQTKFSLQCTSLPFSILTQLWRASHVTVLSCIACHSRCSRAVLR